MRTLLLVGTGSFLGGVCRYLLSQFIQQKAASVFPVGTLAVNLLGCFLIGCVLGLSQRNGGLHNDWLLFLTTGLLGGFTTFSAFSNETVLLLRSGETLWAIGYVAASVLLGLLATFVAYSFFR